jgi:hypothetical protein
MAGDPYYQKCSRIDDLENCSGRITFEHAWIYAGKQIDEKWAIVPECVYHHLSTGLDKSKNKLIALMRATAEDLAKYPKTNWERLFNYLVEGDKPFYQQLLKAGFVAPVFEAKPKISFGPKKPKKDSKFKTCQCGNLTMLTICDLCGKRI